MVARSNIDGNEDNSKGRDTLMAIMMITSPITILKVNSTSSKNGGSGKINIGRIKRIKTGMPSPDSSKVDRVCRIVDMSAVAIKNITF